MKKILPTIVASAVDLILSYGGGLLIACIIWKIAGWSVSPYLYLVGFGIGKFAETFIMHVVFGTYEERFNKLNKAVLLSMLPNINIEDLMNKDTNKEDEG